MFVNQLFEHLVCLKAAVLMFAISGVGATLPRHLNFLPSMIRFDSLPQKLGR